jgi:hypothetical protein
MLFNSAIVLYVLAIIATIGTYEKWSFLAPVVVEILVLKNRFSKQD